MSLTITFFQSSQYRLLLPNSAWETKRKLARIVVPNQLRDRS
jgi:hypothetical protein